MRTTPWAQRGLLLVAAAILVVSCGGRTEEELAYSELKERIEVGQVAEVRITPYRIEAEPTPEAREAGAPDRWTAAPIPGDEQLVPLLDARGVVYAGETTAGPRPWVILPVLFAGIVAVLVILRVQRRRAGEGHGLSGLRIRDATREPTPVRFSDVAGADEAKEELEEVVQFLKRPDAFARLGARIPKGVLLVGPPGTGKTLLARAVAGEAGVPFFSISGSEFVEMFVGVGASRVRKLFEKAKSRAPCIVFIDELDAAGKSRVSGGVAGNDEREQTLNQLLVEMDGFESRRGIIVIAATNRPEILDSALLRPGRFDRQVAVGRPDRSGREAILRVHARDVRLAEEVDLGAIAQRTPGFVGADLANILNEAALLAARRALPAVGMAELDAAIDRVVAGLEKKGRLMDEKERRIVAYHEAGHAIVAERSPTADPVQKISILPRASGALGYMQQLPAERNLLQEDELVDRLAVLLGGRAAEEIVFGQVSTGASNDLERVTELARRMVCEFGMSSVIGPVAYQRQSSGYLASTAAGAASGFSESTAREIDQEVQSIVAGAAERAREILAHDRAALEEVAGRLLADEVMDREALLAILGAAGPTDAEEGRGPAGQVAATGRTLA